MVNIKCFDPNQIKINKKSYKNVFINCMGYVTIHAISYALSY